MLESLKKFVKETLKEGFSKKIISNNFWENPGGRLTPDNLSWISGGSSKGFSVGNSGEITDEI